MVQKSDEWKRERHLVLDEHIKEMRVRAHRLMDRIIDAPFLNDESYIFQPDSLQVLAQTVLSLICWKYKVGPNNKQVLWKAEMEILKRWLK